MHIQIKEFSGPLDLLLQLIRREEMDIFDIDIHKITEQYLTFIKENAVMDLDSAGDFIRMAALLIYIKSKSLFPSAEDPAEVEEESEEVLQKQLVHSLLKMRAVQSVAGRLRQKPLLNKDVWSAGGQDAFSALFPEGRAENIKSQPVLKLMRAYHKLFHKGSVRASGPVLSLQDPLPFLSDCIRSIHHRLTLGAKIKMSALIKRKNALSHTLVTFLALLELSRLGIVSLAQEKEFADIAVCVKRRFGEGDFRFVKELEEQRSENSPTA